MEGAEMCDCNQSASTNHPTEQPATNNIQATPTNAASAEQVSAFHTNLLNHPALLQQLSGVRYRILSTLSLESEEKDTVTDALSPNRSAVIYDYSNNRSLEVSADFPAAANISVSTTSNQPLPSAEEWAEAAE